jgi:hypothetical protein
MIPPLSPILKKYFDFSLTLSSLSPSLSSAMKPALKKLSSFLFVTLAYAVAGYAFFLIFFKSQF